MIGPGDLKRLAELVKGAQDVTKELIDAVREATHEIRRLREVIEAERERAN